ncbi:MAG: NADH-quinone oxidoreductase subunit C [Microthrixaceae bacterium]
MSTEAPATDDATEDEVEERDEAREALVDSVRHFLGDAVVASEVIPGRDTHVRVATDAWGEAAQVVRYDLGFRYFCFLSVLDWLPSPYGRYLETEPETLQRVAAEAGDAELTPGVCGADRRFQVFARVRNLSTNQMLCLRADTSSDDDPTVPTWVNTFAGAEWHEREAWEMFGVTFEGHPGLRNIYLPGDFEGNPLRKDFPLLSRLVKPWPGIVDVEKMPEPDEPEAPAEPDASTEAAAPAEAAETPNEEAS